MLQTGAFHTLPIVSVQAAGATLGDDDVRLPAEEIPEGASVGDAIRVFVSADQQGRLLATTQTPAVVFGEFACLSVVDQTLHGAFLDWGLKKDLFVPKKEQPKRMLVGLKYAVTLTRDVQGRVMGSGRVENFLDLDLSALTLGQPVKLLVYEFHDLGAKVIVDQRYGGMIYDDDIYFELEIGSRLTGFVGALRGDGKLDIRLRRTGRAALRQGQDQLLTVLLGAGGYLPLHDKSSPGEVYETVQMSKKAFKRSVGNLLKVGRLRLEEGGIRLLAGEPARDESGRR